MSTQILTPATKLLVKPLYWVEVLLIKLLKSPTRWFFASQGSQVYAIQSELLLNQTSINNWEIETIWHPFPVIEETDAAVKISKPPTTLFTLNHHLVDGYLQLEFDLGVITYHNWSLKDAKYVRPMPHPHPCTQCGWYCSQLCNYWY